VLGFFAVDTARTAPETFGAIIGIALLSVILDHFSRGTHAAAGRLEAA